MTTKSKRPQGKAQRPLVVGTGLVALDTVISRISNEPTRYWSGGTCANVLIVLSYLGWRAQPIARLGVGNATDLVLNDLRRWKVSERFIRTGEDGGTPVIVERITKDSAGRPRHSYSWRCTDCGYPFPGYKPELSSIAEKYAGRIKDAKVFFFDRVSAGAIVLAKACASKGALVVFEPSGIGNPVLFQQAWEAAHVVKYSHERLSELPDMDVATSPRLQIETLGEAGLRYQRVDLGKKFTKWIELKGFAVNELKDTAGAGDWCTAGMLSQVGKAGLKGFLKTSDSDLREALRYGQALATWNCRFEGPRGGMYLVDRNSFSKQVAAILGGTTAIEQHRREPADAQSATTKGLCHACDGPAKAKRHRA